MAEPRDPSGSEPAISAPVAPARQPGWREVATIAVVIVVGVFAVSVVTDLVPGLARAVRELPLLILVLIGGTAFVVWRILRAPSVHR